MEQDKLYTELYERRVLVFMEEEPQSNKYRQIGFTKETYKNLTSSLGKVISTEGEGENREVEMSDELYELPDLQTILPPPNP